MINVYVFLVGLVLIVMFVLFVCVPKFILGLEKYVCRSQDAWLDIVTGSPKPINFFWASFTFLGSLGVLYISVSNYYGKMELDLTPKREIALYEGDGGGYYVWSSSEMPVLASTNVGACRLLLKPRGFCLPHYADISKVGYVIQVAKIAGEEGMVTYSFVTTTKPSSGEFVGTTSIWGDLSPIVQQVSLNVDSEFQKSFISKTNKTTTIIPTKI